MHFVYAIMVGGLLATLYVGQKMWRVFQTQKLDPSLFALYEMDHHMGPHANAVWWVTDRERTDDGTLSYVGAWAPAVVNPFYLATALGLVGILSGYAYLKQRSRRDRVERPVAAMRSAAPVASAAAAAAVAKAASRAASIAQAAKAASTAKAAVPAPPPPPQLPPKKATKPAAPPKSAGSAGAKSTGNKSNNALTKLAFYEGKHECSEDETTDSASDSVSDDEEHTPKVYSALNALVATELWEKARHTATLTSLLEDSPNNMIRIRAST